MFCKQFLKTVPSFLVAVRRRGGRKQWVDLRLVRAPPQGPVGTLQGTERVPDRSLVFGDFKFM